VIEFRPQDLHDKLMVTLETVENDLVLPVQNSVTDDSWNYVVKDIVCARAL